MSIDSIDMAQNGNGNGNGSAYVVGQVRAEIGRQSVKQVALAAAIGMSPAALNLRLNGHQEFKIDELFMIADVLGVPVAQFVPAAPAATK